MAEKQNIDEQLDNCIDENSTNEDQSIHPYMLEPNKGEEEEFSDSSESSTSDEAETANSWRLSTSDWCKCRNCSVMDKTVESFCCHEMAIEHDEYDEKLTNAENQGFQCITNVTSFQQNMLSKEVLHINVLQYMEEHWLLNDKELERTHKLYRLASYRRCSRWPVFTILGKKQRRVFPSCVYSRIRGVFVAQSCMQNFRIGHRTK